VDVPGPVEQFGGHVGRGERADDALGGEDGPVVAPRQRDGHAGRLARADRHRRGVDARRRELAEHERARRVVADRGDQRDPQAKARGGDGGDRGGPADHQGHPLNQLLLLAEGGLNVVAVDEHVRVAVADHDEIELARAGRPRTRLSAHGRAPRPARPRPR
jgi:hypothetical protein